MAALGSGRPSDQVRIPLCPSNLQVRQVNHHSNQAPGLRVVCLARIWERGAQNRGKERHLIDARRQLSDKLFQAVIQ